MRVSTLKRVREGVKRVSAKEQVHVGSYMQIASRISHLQSLSTSALLLLRWTSMLKKEKAITC